MSAPLIADLRLSTPPEVVRMLGARLRDQRMSRSITQRDLALRAGVALGAIKKLESTGKVTVDTLVQVAAALGLVDEFGALFAIQAHTSIAEMERRELAARKRARPPAGAQR